LATVYIGVTGAIGDEQPVRRQLAAGTTIVAGVTQSTLLIDVRCLRQMTYSAECLGGAGRGLPTRHFGVDHSVGTIGIGCQRIRARRSRLMHRLSHRLMSLTERVFATLDDRFCEVAEVFGSSAVAARLIFFACVKYLHTKGWTRPVPIVFGYHFSITDWVHTTTFRFLANRICTEREPPLCELNRPRACRRWRQLAEVCPWLMCSPVRSEYGSPVLPDALLVKTER
jgi:hypothetical protein